MNQKLSKILAFSMLLLSILAGCTTSTITPSQATTAPTMAAEQTQTSQAITNATATLAPETPQPSATATIYSTPTPDLRPKPENWQQWPVIPTISANAVAIYQKGLTLGNDPTHFSKVGDCQSISEVLLGIYDQDMYMQVFKDQPSLQETLTQFKGSFNRDGMAVEGGFNAAAVLSPIWANPDYCQAGETPIECEYRVHRPSIAIISLEVWWNGRSPEQYEKYMRRIIEFFMERGVLPILSTKADNVEGDHSINYTTARLAYEYDIPLWNFWLAAQSLPNGGLDPVRNDGFHISTDAWSVRSYTALQTLDQAWHIARQGQTVAYQPSATPAAQTTTLQYPTLPLASLLTPTPNQATRVLFSVSERQSNSTNSAGIFVLDTNTGQVNQLFQSGYNLQALAPDGNSMLINQANQLYLARFDQENPQLISDQFFAYAVTGGAMYAKDGQSIFYITGSPNATTLVHHPLNGNPTPITPTDSHPIEILSINQSSSIYWLQGTCTLTGDCRSESTWRSDLSAPTSPQPISVNRPVISPDGALIAYTQQSSADLSKFAFADSALQNPVEVYLSGNHVLNYAWSPDSNWISVMTSVRNDYSGKNLSIRQFLVDRAYGRAFLLTESNGLSPLSVWSPDGLHILKVSSIRSSEKPEDQSTYISIQLIDAQNGANQTDLTSQAGLKSNSFLAITNLFWLLH